MFTKGLSTKIHHFRGQSILYKENTMSPRYYVKHLQVRSEVKMSQDLTQNQLPDFKEQNDPLGTQTTSAGNGVPYPTASKTVGKNGPVLLEDWVLLDELAHFARERVPERVVHAKGSGAFGYFEVTKDITQYTVAKVFEKIGKRTPIAIRFSTVAGHMGSADTVRDPRGFAVKFYAEEGMWDLVGNNTPIFFIRDPIMFPNFIHSQKENPQTGVRDVNAFWDFIGQRPETTHQVMFLFSDRGIPDGYRYMHGFGSHTFVFVNAKEKKYYVKFNYRTDQGIKNLPVKDAGRLAGEDPDYSRRDLYNAIASGNFPSWTLYIQIMTEDQANTFPFNPFDVTKVWPHGDYPLMEVGKLVLNKNPENHFAELEQLAFSPANMPVGIYASYDRMLQGRLFSYHDAHIYRIGVNYQQLPVNCPFRVRNNHRDGAATFNSQGGAPNYVPNRFGGPTPNLKSRQYYPVVDLNGKAKNWDTSTTEDNFKQPGDFYRKVLTEEERQRLAVNIANHMRTALPEVRKLAIKNFADVDPDLGLKISSAIKSNTKIQI